MKYLARIASIFLLSLCGTGAAAADRSNEILQTEQARIAALVRDDYAALDRLLSDDLTYTHSSSVLDSKGSFIASLKEGRAKYKSLEHDDQKVRLYGDTAVLTGRSKVQVSTPKEELNLTLRFTIVYVYTSGRWQMAAWQSTRVPGEKL